MQVVSREFIAGKKVLLRLDLDVPIENGKVDEDFRLKAALPTLRLCLEHASEVIAMGHIGRPKGKKVEELSVAPIYDWLEKQGLSSHLMSGKLKLLENLRFEEGENKCDPEYAKELAGLGEVYINEAFAAHHPAASTTILPTLLPAFAGLHFAREVEVLTKVRGNPGKPLVVIIGGAKVENKLPLVLAMAKIADQVLVGGKITLELVRSSAVSLPANVLIGELNKEGTDIAEETVQKWKPVISGAKMIVWNGPLGKVEEDQNDQSKNIAQLIIKSGAESIIGGGDTITALNKWGLLNKFSFVSTGGGAMLKFLAEGTLPTIEALR
ncbi:MAG: Phosphoglycerate kinase [Candidatus Daviesbacteria bacterium GW2011_GWA2_40_9]|uniref:Phosphoglycerate kinase n=1 Tax=Candidatus Daviesbacteria bacterium GW2011_GWA2_40_9 TaxID=1618424 RepID=A0A0G0X2X3_9BACT|nr:MAG: Phosphoglycerate kinase [Candidatus Daviesbacteria bacterium GW2011_GWA2_40_9]